MKLHERSSQRFVKEFANWKISVLKDMAKSFPERADSFKADIERIEKTYKGWDRGLITTKETMSIINEL